MGQAGIELAIPGSAVTLASVARRNFPYDGNNLLSFIFPNDEFAIVYCTGRISWLDMKLIAEKQITILNHTSNAKSN